MPMHQLRVGNSLERSKVRVKNDQPLGIISRPNRQFLGHCYVVHVMLLLLECLNIFAMINDKQHRRSLSPHLGLWVGTFEVHYPHLSSHSPLSLPSPGGEPV